MTMSDEFIKLEQLHERRSLTDDEFTRAKARLLESTAPAAASPARVTGFRRSRTDRWLGGLCGGLAVETGVDSWIWRLLFTLMFFACGTGLLLYILLWIFVPSE
ncbi:MAG: PspC domain-containing protein [Proteobacteria bacterium]|nr:PspC domain-containing protein [Pseudomonadota bacterium]